MINGGGGYSKLSKRIIAKKDELKEISSGIDFNILDQFVRVLKKVNIFIWCSKLQVLDIMNYFASKGNNYEILVWCKTNPTPSTNNVWLPDIEYCLYFREKGVKLNAGYDLKHKWYMTGINKKDKDKYKHPTIKPLELVKKHIQHTTQEGDTILDCFMGSGTTGVACRELNRNFIGMEINEEYYNIAKDRILGINEQQKLF